MYRNHLYQSQRLLGFSKFIPLCGCISYLSPLWLRIGIFLTRSISKMWSYLGVEVMICWAAYIHYIYISEGGTHFS